MSRASRARETALLAIYDGRRCLGHILSRGKLGFEAFDQNDISLGTFPTEQKAADAVSTAAKEAAP